MKKIFLKIKFFILSRVGYIGCRTCSYELVDVSVARKMIERKEVFLIDVRSQSEYKNLHIKNAINIPVEDIEKNIERLKNEKIMIYCASGRRAKKAIETLNKNNITNIVIWQYSAISSFPYKEMFVK